MNGFLVIDKHEGVTSHGIVHSVRKILNLKKAGHTGTLDPFATGVLPVALGEGTKVIPFLDESVKEYQAVMRLGVSTDTQDCTGRVLRESAFNLVSEAMLQKTFSSFSGEIEQVPPMFSALKRSGVPLYKLARQGESVQREPRKITIFSLSIDKINLPLIYFSVRCSRGTYVRTLANDLGEQLGCGAHLSALRRTASGMFSLNESITLEQLAFLKAEGSFTEYIIPPLRCLPHFKQITLSDKGADRIRCGAVPGSDGFITCHQEDLHTGDKVSLIHGNNLTAIAEIIDSDESDERKKMRLLRVFN
jgi:tRNA pseudouridine55 synthase